MTIEQWPKPFELFIRLWKCSRGLSRGLMQTSSRADANAFFGGCTDELSREEAKNFQHKTPNLQNSLNPAMSDKQHLPSRALSRALVTRALSQKLSRTGAPRTLADAGQSKANPLSNSFMEGFGRRSIGHSTIIPIKDSIRGHTPMLTLTLKP